MTQELLSAADAGRVRVAIGRASDFFGAGVTESTLGERVFANAAADKRADFLGNPDLPHSYSYVPDIAAGLATLGTADRAAEGVWHLPGPETATTRQIVALIAEQVGHPVAVRSMPKLLVRTLGPVNPMMRELAEMAYEFEEPFVLDTSKYESTFGAAGTPLAAAISTTIRLVSECRHHPAPRRGRRRRRPRKPPSRQLRGRRRLLPRCELDRRPVPPRGLSHLSLSAR